MSRLNYLDSYPINFDCPCGIDSIPKKDKLKIQCSLCGVFQHCDCIKNANKMLRYICPICQLNQSDLFQKILYHLLPPSLYKYKPGDEVEITYFRDNKFHTTKVKLTKNEG